MISIYKAFKKLFNFLPSYLEFEDFAKEIKKRECKIVKGECFSKPLFQPRAMPIEEIDEKILGESFYIRLSSCDGKIVYSKIIEVERELKGEYFKREKLVDALNKKVKELEELLDPYKIEVIILENGFEKKEKFKNKKAR